MKFLKRILVGILVCAGFIFFLQNYQDLSRDISFEFGFYKLKFRSFPLPLGVYFILFFLFGYIIGVLVTFRERIYAAREKYKANRITRQQEKQKKQEEKEDLKIKKEEKGVERVDEDKKFDG